MKKLLLLVGLGIMPIGLVSNDTMISTVVKNVAQKVTTLVSDTMNTGSKGLTTQQKLLLVALPSAITIITHKLVKYLQNNAQAPREEVQTSREEETLREEQALTLLPSSVEISSSNFEGYLTDSQHATLQQLNSIAVGAERNIKKLNEKTLYQYLVDGLIAAGGFDLSVAVPGEPKTFVVWHKASESYYYFNGIHKEVYNDGI